MLDVDPLLHKPVILKGGDGQKHWIVDGGMLSNFPISLFDAPRAWSLAGRRSASSCPPSPPPCSRP